MTATRSDSGRRASGCSRLFVASTSNARTFSTRFRQPGHEGHGPCHPIGVNRPVRCHFAGCGHSEHMSSALSTGTCSQSSRSACASASCLRASARSFRPRVPFRATESSRTFVRSSRTAVRCLETNRLSDSSLHSAASAELTQTEPGFNALPLPHHRHGPFVLGCAVVQHPRIPFSILMYLDEEDPRFDELLGRRGCGATPK